jgi:hypothetical protein
MAKPRKAEKHIVTGRPILKVGGGDFKAPDTLPSLLKFARLTVEKVIGDLVEPVIERCQK